MLIAADLQEAVANHIIQRATPKLAQPPKININSPQLKVGPLPIHITATVFQQVGHLPAKHSLELEMASKIRHKRRPNAGRI